ncbi:MAG: V-type ATP synthase subunit F [Sedimenticola sp.]
MQNTGETSPATRMLFLGDATLTDGFQLIGFETIPDPSVAELDRILRELIEHKHNAFIILDHRLSESNSRLLARVRAEGGRIVVTEVPQLNKPEQFHCKIDNQVRMLMGDTNMKDCSNG